jgi:predicted PurR-regulated permease PerM
MAINRFYFFTLIVLVFLLGYLNYQVWKPFLTPLAWAIVLSILFYPLYAFMLKLLRQRAITSALVLCLLLILILGPFSYLTFLLVKELTALPETMAGVKLEAIKNLMQHPSVMAVTERVTSLLNIRVHELDQAVMDQISRLGKELVGGLTKGVREILTVAFHFVIMALSIFFFLKDGPTLFGKARDFLPFSENQKERLVSRARDLIISTIYGGVIVAMAQGTLGGIAFAIVGITSPILWGAMMALASFLPVVGPFIIWGPATVYLLVEGAIFRGISLAVMGALGIGLVDNLLRPLIIGNRTKMPFLAIFFSVLGGIKLFGIIGFIMGPMVLVLFLSVIEIFRSMEESSHA